MFPDDWTPLAEITFNHLEVIEDLSDQWVMLLDDHFPDPVYDNCQAGAQDLRITTDLAGTLIPIEIVEWDKPGKTGKVFTLLPALSSAVDTLIYVWGKNASAAPLDPTDPNGRFAVWADFVFVSHMLDLDSSTIFESTDDQNHPVKSAADNPLEVAGPIGSCQDFLEDNARALGDNIIFGSADNFTIRAYVQTDYIAAANKMIATIDKNVAGRDVFHFKRRITRRLNITYGDTGGVIVNLDSNWLWDDTGWHYMVGQKDAAADKTRLFVDGQLDKESPDNSTPFTVTPDYMYIGAYRAILYRWAGKQAELLISKDVPSQGQLETEFNNFDSPSTFTTGVAFTFPLLIAAHLLQPRGRL